MKRFLTLTTLLCCAFSYAQTKHTASNYESIESVAKIYRFSPADILKLNPGVKDGIQKGTTINIPVLTWYNLRKLSLVYHKNTTSRLTT